MAEWLHDTIDKAARGHRLESIVRLDRGEINETFRVVLSSGVDLVVRRSPEDVADWHATVEGQVAAMELARSVDVPVPEVVYAGGRVLVYRFVPGTSMDLGAAPGLARAAGRLHGRLHTVPGDGIGPVQADGGSPRWPTDIAFRDVPTWVHRLLSSPELGPIAAADVVAAARLLEAPPHPEARLVHGDASPGNTIIRKGAVVALIDFDDAWFGDPAGDLAWWWWNDPSTSEEFDAGSAETYRRQEPRTVWLYRLRLLLGLADTFAFNHPARAEKIGRLLPEAVNRAALAG